MLRDNEPPSVKVSTQWGYFEQYSHNLSSTVKIITVEPAGMLSRQYHDHRDELWVVLDPGARSSSAMRSRAPSPRISSLSCGALSTGSRATVSVR